MLDKGFCVWFVFLEVLQVLEEYFEELVDLVVATDLVPVQGQDLVLSADALINSWCP